MSKFTEAEAKINADRDKSQYSRERERIVCAPTADAMIEFCRQSEALCEKVVSGKPFAECIKSIMANVQNYAVESVDVYSRAVAFYFPEARLERVLKIIEPETEKNSGKVIELDFTAFL